MIFFDIRHLFLFFFNYECIFLPHLLFFTKKCIICEEICMLPFLHGLLTTARDRAQVLTD